MTIENAHNFVRDLQNIMQNYTDSKREIANDSLAENDQMANIHEDTIDYLEILARSYKPALKDQKIDVGNSNDKNFIFHVMYSQIVGYNNEQFETTKKLGKKYGIKSEYSDPIYEASQHWRSFAEKNVPDLKEKYSDTIYINYMEAVAQILCDPQPQQEQAITVPNFSPKNFN